VKYSAKWSVVGVFVFLVLWVGWVWHRTAVLERAFNQVKREDSPTRVVDLFGQPPYVTTNTETDINWDEIGVDKTNGIRCVFQFHFYPPFTICGESWVVGFDECSNAVCKYHIVSP
jgi:hypothetical protein